MVWFLIGRKQFLDIVTKRTNKELFRDQKTSWYYRRWRIIGFLLSKSLWALSSLFDFKRTYFSCFELPLPVLVRGLFLSWQDRSQGRGRGRGPAMATELAAEAARTERWKRRKLLIWYCQAKPKLPLDSASTSCASFALPPSSDCVCVCMCVVVFAFVFPPSAYCLRWRNYPFDTEGFISLSLASFFVSQRHTPVV